MAKVSIIIPVYNERETILGILSKIEHTNFGAAELEVIVVDGASTDGTREILRRLDHPWLRVVYEEERRGKGVAVAKGFKISTGDAVIIQDADDEYDPADIPSIVGPILDRKCRAAYGSRFKGQIRYMTGSRRIANMALTAFINVLYGSKLTDACTCYKALDGDLARGLELETASFDVCMEITAKTLRGGAKVLEVPISYRARKQDEGVKSDWTAFPRAVGTVVRYRFVPIKPLEPRLPDTAFR